MCLEYRFWKSVNSNSGFLDVAFIGQLEEYK